MQTHRLLLILSLVAGAYALHDGRFVHADPWKPVTLLDEVRQSVLWDIIPSLFFYGALATGVCLLNQLQHHIYVGLPSTMLTVLGTVIGFTVSYRTSSAYGRFLEGAHLWGETIATCRTLARTIWLHVPNYAREPAAGQKPHEDERIHILLEKKTVLNLIEAYAVALKHYLRGESSIYFEDLYALTCMLPKYSMPTSIPISRPDLAAPHHPHHGKSAAVRMHDMLDPIFRLTPATPQHHLKHANTSPSPSEHSQFHHGHRHPHHHGAEEVSGPISVTPIGGHVPTPAELKTSRPAEKDEKESSNLEEKIEKVVEEVEDGLAAAVDSLLHPDHAHDRTKELMRVNTAPIQLQHEHQRGRSTTPAPAYSSRHSQSSHGSHSSGHHSHRARSLSPVRASVPLGHHHSAHSSTTSFSARPHRSGSVHSVKSNHSHHSASSAHTAHHKGAFHGPRNPPFPLAPARNPPRFSLVDDALPFLAPFKWLWLWLRRHAEPAETKLRRHHKANLRKKMQESDNVPLELILHFSNYVALLQRRKILDVPTTNALLNSMTALQQQLTSLEKILSTPIPLAYQLHLKHATMVYLCFLPFQLEPILGYNSIPAVLLAAFMFLGFLEIGQAIESPFGYDRNDLDLDEYCQAIVAKELKEITAHPPLEFSDIVFLHTNEPLAPADKRSAQQLLDEKVSFSECEKALLRGHERDRGWRQQRAKLEHRGNSLDV